MVPRPLSLLPTTRSSAKWTSVRCDTTHLISLVRFLVREAHSKKARCGRIAHLLKGGLRSSFSVRDRHVLAPKKQTLG